MDAAATQPVANAAVTAFEGTTEVSTTSTGTDGTYTLGGLHTATYRVEFSAMGFQDASVDNVSVTAGQTTSGVNANLTPAAKP